MWKKHLERDDSIIVGEESQSSPIHPLFLSPLKQTADHSGPLSLQICSQASCGAHCIAQSALTTPTRLMCSAICHCPSPRGVLLGRSRSGSVWTSSLRRRNWTRRIRQ